MRVAVSGDEGFIAHYLQAQLGDACQILTPEIIDDKDMLPAILASCNTIVHFNGHPPDQSMARSDQVRRSSQMEKSFAGVRSAQFGVNLCAFPPSTRPGPSTTDTRARTPHA